jgi:hypothetical protein
MEYLFDDGEIRKRDLDAVYEALFLRAVTSFESFLEDLFLGILEGRVKYHSRKGISRKVIARTREAMNDIVFHAGDGRKNQFLSWLPFDKTEDRAMIYLVDGKPFSSVDRGDRSIVKTITIVRNAIAHRSKYSMDAFREKVIGEQALLKNERTPAGYLQSRVHSGGNRFESYVGTLGKVAREIC